MANALDAGVPTLADLMDKRVRLHQPHQAAHAATCQAESQLQPLMSGLHMLHQPVMIIFIFVIVIISIITNSISIGISTFIIVFAFGFIFIIFIFLSIDLIVVVILIAIVDQWNGCGRNTFSSLCRFNCWGKPGSCALTSLSTMTNSPIQWGGGTMALP